jgi:hypothetical protein
MSTIRTAPTEWIYFFEEPKRHKGLIELGRTGRTVEDRNRDKRSIDRWIEIASYPVANCIQAEKEIIKATKKYRYNNRREILEINWPTLNNIVEPILNQYTDVEYRFNELYPILINEYDQQYYYPIAEQLKKEDDLKQDDLRSRHSDEMARVRVKNNLDGSSFIDSIRDIMLWTSMILIFSWGITVGMKSVPNIFKFLQIPLGVLLAVVAIKVDRKNAPERRKILDELYLPAKLEYDIAIKDHKMTYYNLYDSLKKQRDGNHTIINQIVRQEVQDAVKKKDIPVPNKVWIKILSQIKLG